MVDKNVLTDAWDYVL